MITPDMKMKTTIKMEVKDENGKTKILEGEFNEKTPYNEKTGQFIIDFKEVE